MEYWRTDSVKQKLLCFTNNILITKPLFMDIVGVR